MDSVGGGVDCRRHYSHHHRVLDGRTRQRQSHRLFSAPGTRWHADGGFLPIERLFLRWRKSQRQMLLAFGRPSILRLWGKWIRFIHFKIQLFKKSWKLWQFTGSSLPNPDGSGLSTELRRRRQSDGTEVPSLYGGDIDQVVFKVTYYDDHMLRFTVSTRSSIVIVVIIIEHNLSYYFLYYISSMRKDLLRMRKNHRCHWRCLCQASRQIPCNICWNSRTKKSANLLTSRSNENPLLKSCK